MSGKGMSVFRNNGEDFTINDPNNAVEFITTDSYAAGEFVYHEGLLYMFITDHSAGNWDSSHVVQVMIGRELENVKKDAYQGAMNFVLGLDHNLFNYKAAIKGQALNGTTGKFYIEATSMVSQKIVYDFTKRATISGITLTPNVYCYDLNDVYLGRYNVNTDTDTVAIKYPATAYVRIVPALTDTAVVFALIYGKQLSDYEPTEGWLEKSGKIARLADGAETENEYGNFFNEKDAAVNRDISSSDGHLVVSSGYVASGKIVMDFSRRIAVKNSTYNYLFAYDSDDEYLGRIDWTSTGSAIATFYPNVAYIRVLAKATDSNVMVMYFDRVRNVYTAPNFVIPFSGIGKSLQKYMLSDTKNIRIGSYNLGDFTGRDLTPDDYETLYIYRKAIAKIGSDVCLFQYDIPNFNSTPAGNSIYSQKAFREWHGSQRYDYFGVGSDYPFMYEHAVQYANAGSYPLTHTWFEVFDMPIHGRIVHFVNIHLEWKDTTYRDQQITEILAHVADYDYCVVCGDFNPEDRTYDPDTGTSSWNGDPGTLTYTADLARFEEAGFSAGNAGAFGVFNTIGDPGSQNLNGPWDNILVKGNIKIKGFGTIEESYMDDHYPVYADITIY